MYGFVDTIAGSGTGSTSLSLQTVFNGNNLDELLTDDNGSFITLTVTGRSNLTQRVQTTEVPGMDGLLEQTNPTVSEREITIKYKMADRTNNGFRKRYDRLLSLLEGSKKVLTFTDEDALFYATLLTNETPEEETNNLIGTITFLCSDPFKYGKEQTKLFTSDILTLPYKGTAPASPIFELEVKEPVTFAMIQNQLNEYMMIGKPFSVEGQPPYKKYERIFYNDATSMIGWTDGQAVDGGIVAGTMETNGIRFQARDYGKGSYWHGPAIKQSLSEVLIDFKCEVFITHFNGSRSVGRIEIYLLDTQGNVVGKMAMKDTQSGRTMNWGEVRAGDVDKNYFLINEAGDNPGAWNNFRGIMRIERNGNLWRGYIGEVNTETGVHHTRRVVEWEDTRNRFTREVAQIQLHMGQFGSHTHTNGGIYSMHVYKINQEQGIPYIADVGDVITIDGLKEEIRINGEPRNDLLTNFGSDFFKLIKGENQLTAMPFESFNITTKYREAHR